MPFANLDEDAIPLARALQSLSSFLHAATELLRIIQSAHASAVRRQQKKIVVLIELARQTLLRAGVVAHKFAACPRHLLSRKDAFFDLLCALRDARAYADAPELQARIDRLLLPLSSNFRVGRLSALLHGWRPTAQPDQHAPPLRHARHLPLDAPPPAFSGPKIKSTDIVRRERARSESLETPPSSPPPRTPSPPQRQQPRVTVVVSEDDGDGQWLDVIDASNWLAASGSHVGFPSQCKIAQRQLDMDTDVNMDDEEEDDDDEVFVYPGAEQYEEEEEEPEEPQYKKGKFGIFCSAAYNQSKARGYH